MTRTLPAAGRPRVLFPILAHDRWGFIDSTGRIVIPPRFESTVTVEGERRMGETQSRSTRPRTPDLFMAPGVGPESTWALGVKVGGRWGLTDQRGTLIGGQRFDEIDAFSEGLAPVRAGDRWGFVDASGRLALAPQYGDVARFRGGLCVVTVDALRGVIDPDGQYVIKPRFETIGGDDSVFSSGRALVRTEGRSGFVNRAGLIAVPAMYDDASSFSEGLAAVAREGAWGYIDTTGRMVIAPRFDGGAPFERGLARVSLAGRSGLIDRTGAFVAPPQYDEIADFAGRSAALARRGDEVGYLDRSGRWSGSFCDTLLTIDDSLAVGRIGNVTGIVRRASGTMLRPYPWEEVGAFVEGRCPVRHRGTRYGFIDPTGALVIPLRFDEVDRFRHGVCKVSAGDTLGYVDRSGAWLWSGRFPGYRRRYGGHGP